MLADRPGRTRARSAGAALCCVGFAASIAAACRAGAQLPDLPTAQSAFPAPGLAVALDAGHGDGRTVPALAAATGVRRLQLTAAAGLPGAIAGYDRSGISLGARLAARLFRTPSLGVSAFAGYGAESMRGNPLTASLTAGTTAPSQPTGRFTQVPVGISAGLRGLAGDRPYAISLAPMYAYSRWAIADTARTRSGARVAALAEVAVTPSIGVGVAVEVGSGGPLGSPYAGRGTVFGAGVSYAIHRVVAR